MCPASGEPLNWRHRTAPQCRSSAKPGDQRHHADHQQRHQPRCWFGGGADEAGMLSAEGSASASCNSSRASAMWCSRSRGSFVRQRTIRRRRLGVCAAGSARQSGSLASTLASRSDTSSPPNGRRPASISNSTHPKAQMSLAPVDRLAARLLGTHVRGGAEDHAGLRHARAIVIVGGRAIRPCTIAPAPWPSRGRSRAASRCRRRAP